MGDKEAFIKYLGNIVEVKTKQKEHFYGKVTIVTDNFIYLDHVMNNGNQPCLDKFYHGTEDISEIVNSIGNSQVTLRYEIIDLIKPMCSAKGNLRSLGLPQNLEAEIEQFERKV